jgi:hypothetical protein
MDTNGVNDTKSDIEVEGKEESRCEEILINLRINEVDLPESTINLVSDFDYNIHYRMD